MVDLVVHMSSDTMAQWSLWDIYALMIMKDFFQRPSSFNNLMTRNIKSVNTKWGLSGQYKFHVAPCWTLCVEGHEKSPVLRGSCTDKKVFVSCDHVSVGRRVQLCNSSFVAACLLSSAGL